MAAEINSLLQRDEIKNKQGSLKSLYKHNFGEAASKIISIQSELKMEIPKPVVAPKIPAVKREIKVAGLFPVVEGKVKLRGRVYSEKNLKVTNFQRKGKDAYNIYNTRLKRNITWGYRK